MGDLNIQVDTKGGISFYQTKLAKTTYNGMLQPETLDRNETIIFFTKIL